MTEQEIFYIKKFYPRMALPRPFEEKKIKTDLQKLNCCISKIYHNLKESIQLLSEKELTDDKDYYLRGFDYCLKHILEIMKIYINLDFYIEQVFRVYYQQYDIVQ